MTDYSELSDEELQEEFYRVEGIRATAEKNFKAIEFEQSRRYVTDGWPSEPGFYRWSGGYGILEVVERDGVIYYEDGWHNDFIDGNVPEGELIKLSDA